MGNGKGEIGAWDKGGGGIQVTIIKFSYTMFTKFTGIKLFHQYNMRCNTTLW